MASGSTTAQPPATGEVPGAGGGATTGDVGGADTTGGATGEAPGASMGEAPGGDVGEAPGASVGEAPGEPSGDGGAGTDTGAGDAAEAAGQNAVRLLEAYNRHADLTCPCHVEEGDFASIEECVGTIGYTDEHFACLGTAVTQNYSESLGTTMQCYADSAIQRNDCLDGLACGDERFDCFELGQDCTLEDTQGLTAILFACPDVSVLGR